MVLRTVLWPEDGCLQGFSNVRPRSGSSSPASPRSLPLVICPVPISLSQNLKAATLSEKARNTAVSPIPCGGVPALPSGSRCKEQLWGWKDAQLAAKQGLERWRTKQGDTGKWQGSPNSRNPGKTAFVLWPGNRLERPCQIPQTWPKPCPSQCWQPGPLGRTFCKLHFMIPT